MDQGDLGVEPRPAGGDLGRVRLGVNPPLAARLPLEVLHRVGDVGLTPIDTGFLEGAIEQLAGRPDERPATQVLVVARLLTDEHDPRVSLAFAEDGLGRALIEVTARAAGGGLPQSLERGPDRRNERRGGRMWLARRHARLYARRRANGAERQCAGASARAAGIRMRNDAPRPPRFSAVISPPRSRMIPAEIERPSPVPLRLVV